MQKLLITSAAAFLICWCATLGFSDPKRCEILNDTEQTIYYIYISPADSDDWEEDVLGDTVLAPRQRIEVHFTGYPEEQCYFDILAIDENENEYFVWNVNVCKVYEIPIQPHQRLFFLQIQPPLNYMGILFRTKPIYIDFSTFNHFHTGLFTLDIRVTDNG